MMETEAVNGLFYRGKRLDGSMTVLFLIATRVYFGEFYLLINAMETQI